MFLNDEEELFPEPRHADAQGLIAVGGALTPKRLLKAYRQGIFPWYEEHTPVLWWSPDPRLILRPQEFILSRSLRKTLNKPFQFSIDKAFLDVIKACASSPGRLHQTWITSDMISAYCELHALGFAHSFEVWQQKTLIGGLYGISLGKAFFGESMFHSIRDASKLAMYFLCQTLHDWKFDFIDCQMPTAHLQSLGAKVISRNRFLDLLEQTLKHPTCQGQWSTPFF